MSRKPQAWVEEACRAYSAIVIGLAIFLAAVSVWHHLLRGLLRDYNMIILARAKDITGLGALGLTCMGAVGILSCLYYGIATPRLLVQRTILALCLLALSAVLLPAIAVA
jgi:hypothetical protein